MGWSYSISRIVYMKSIAVNGSDTKETTTEKNIELMMKSVKHDTHKSSTFSPAVCSISWLSYPNDISGRKWMKKSVKIHDSSWRKFSRYFPIDSRSANKMKIFKVKRPDESVEDSSIELPPWEVGMRTHNFIHGHRSDADEWIFEVWAHLRWKEKVE